MNTTAQLLWIEALLKGSGGLFLTLAPITTAKLFGLPVTPSGFWVRLLGSVLLGLAAATWIEGAMRNGLGLGLAGALAINLSSITFLVLMLASGRAAPKARGRLSLWLLVAILSVLSVIEFLVVAAR